MTGRRRRPRWDRNDLRQYDDLAGEWWRPGGAFAALHWLAAARAELIPPAPRPGAVLVDAACGGGLLRPYVQGYRYIGVDVVASAVAVASRHGATALQGDITALPLRSGCADVVVAGEVFEHVAHLETAVAEIARVLRHGGTLVFDTINDTRSARLSLLTVGERLPGGPPPRIHDPDLFVSPERIGALCSRHGIRIEIRGLRPSLVDYLRFLARRDRPVRMLPSSSVAGLYQGRGCRR
ncbi:MAG: methyltransferase domain-containing protein [Actinomycetota bacterium]|nr:methyltransferase domain-containing protein [Actinomycetota bacterium]